MSEKVYIWILKLYPATFRAEYGADALQLFLDRLHAERGGFRARCRLWFDVIVDLAVSIPREYGVAVDGMPSRNLGDIASRRKLLQP